jgi:hypothetical protein
MSKQTDIDMDFADRNEALKHLPHIPASMNGRDGNYVRHNSGVYFQNIPINPFTELASIPYEEADQLGYFKLDFLNNSIYAHVRDGAHLDQLLAKEPEWSLLEDSEFVEMLAHIHNHFDVVKTIKPQSVTDLAICLALIRPAKKHLLNKSRTEIDNNIWVPPTDDTYWFKKAHAFSYAMSITVQMNLIVEQVLSSGNDNEAQL